MARVATDVPQSDWLTRTDTTAAGPTLRAWMRLQRDRYGRGGNAFTEAVQVTAAAAPLVDTRSTLIAHNVSAEEFDRLPKGRSFQSIAMTAPSVNEGIVGAEQGLQVNGASGAENSFTVDGIVTNSLINGQSRQNTVFEYLQEVQVKTSGISAEYGGALGGVDASGSLDPEATGCAGFASGHATWVAPSFVWNVARER